MPVLPRAVEPFLRIEQGLRVGDAAQAAGVSVRTAYKWLRRFQEEGEAGLADRSSRPKHCPQAQQRIEFIDVPKRVADSPAAGGPLVRYRRMRRF